MAADSSVSVTTQQPKKHKGKKTVLTILNLIVLILSAMLIVFMSLETFKNVDFLENHNYMSFQLWVCIVFIIDFFAGLFYADHKWKYFKRHLIFLLLSIPYLNIISLLDINLSYDTMYFIRFIPLARGALAMGIVMGYLSSNAISSLLMSYIVIMVLMAYFCSLIFYQRESGVNPQVDSYWTALWWSCMNMSTVGCYINPVTASGKIVAVVLPIAGMVIFPLFTVYLTDFVSRKLNKTKQKDS